VRYLVLASLLLTLNATAAATDTSSKPKAKILNAKVQAFRSEFGNVQLSSKGGAFISACTPKSGKCLKGKLPKALGTVRKIVQGAFVQRSAASWIAVTKDKSYVCGLAPASSRINCALIGKARLDNVTLTFVAGAGKDKDALSFSAVPGSSQPLLYARTFAFLEGLKAASERLQTQLDGDTSQRLITINANDTACDTDGGDDGDDGGGDDGDDGGGDDGGGDDGAGDFDPPAEPEEPGDEVWPDQQSYTPSEIQVVQIIGHAPAGVDTIPVGWNCASSGFVISCQYTPPLVDPELPPAPQPSAFSWCGTFGLFCSVSRSLEEALAKCADTWDHDQAYCDSMSRIMGGRWWQSCREDSRLKYQECRDAANASHARPTLQTSSPK